MRRIINFVSIGLLLCTYSYAQYPIRPSTLSIQKIIRTAPNTINFSIYFKNTASDSAIQYSGGQFHIDFNKAILNGGTGNLSIVSSNLPANVQSTNPTVYTASTPGQLRLAPKAPPGALVGGYFVNPGDSVLVANLNLTTTASSFASWTSHNLTWRKAPDANPITKVSAYIWNSNQIITSNTTFVVYPSTHKELNLTALIEGLYDGSTLTPDTINVELRNASIPYAVVDTSSSILNTSGNGLVNFFSAADAVNYYLVIKHRNALQTWSATAQSFSGGLLNYDFTSSASQAYGSNQVLIGSKYCIYSGDVSDGITAGVQDGYIDIFDDFEVYNDSYSAAYRLLTDLNLDGFVDIFDDLYVYNNSYNGVTASYPGFPLLNKYKKDIGFPKTKEKID